MMKCEICGKEYKNEQGLKFHKARMHQDVPVLHETPVACPTCGATSLTVVPGAPKRVSEISGEWEGQRYTRVVWRRKRCGACGQHVVVRTLECGA